MKFQVAGISPYGSAQLVLVDYKKGNQQALTRAFEEAGVQVCLSADPKLLASAYALALPGVGAFADAMDFMKSHEQKEALQAALLKGAALLGICLGMQLLFERGDEGSALQDLQYPGAKTTWTQGLNIFPGHCSLLQSNNCLLPHRGWDEVCLHEWAISHELMKGMPYTSCFYFNHSYVTYPANTRFELAFCTYGLSFPAIVGKDRVYGVQFHPEKSGELGFKLIKNFCDLAFSE